MTSTPATPVDLFADNPPPAQTSAPARRPAPPPTRRTPTPVRAGSMIIGRSVHITGELTGNEDITIDGGVDGKILVKDHSLTVDRHARIQAEIYAVSVIVTGMVVGNITASQKIELRDGGQVEGDLFAPTISLAEGASFTGRIDMSKVPDVPDWAEPLIVAQEQFDAERPEPDPATAQTPAATGPHHEQVDLDTPEEAGAEDIVETTDDDDMNGGLGSMFDEFDPTQA